MGKERLDTKDHEEERKSHEEESLGHREHRGDTEDHRETDAVDRLDIWTFGVWHVST